jgi:transcriptional regulator with XRE-family HTH domain
MAPLFDMSFSGVILVALVEATAGFSGDKLRALRLGQGLTQAELAHRAHVRERQIIRWENGQHVPRIESISALARVLKCRVTELMGPDEENAEEDGDGESDPVADLVTALKAFVRDELAIINLGLR